MNENNRFDLGGNYALKKERRWGMDALQRTGKKRDGN